MSIGSTIETGAKFNWTVSTNNSRVELRGRKQQPAFNNCGGKRTVHLCNIAMYFLKCNVASTEARYMYAGPWMSWWHAFGLQAQTPTNNYRSVIGRQTTRNGQMHTSCSCMDAYGKLQPEQTPCNLQMPFKIHEFPVFYQIYLFQKTVCARERERERQRWRWWEVGRWKTRALTSWKNFAQRYESTQVLWPLWNQNFPQQSVELIAWNRRLLFFLKS